MARLANKFGGGATTNANGLRFEQETSLNYALINAGYNLIDNKVIRDGVEIGFSLPQAKVYKFLSDNGINYIDYNSKQWRPDECFINKLNSTAYIIEKKYQNGAGSVDEKLPGCQFKKMEYEKLFHPLGMNVKFAYIFNDWFKSPKYNDTLQYINWVGCYYFFNEIPLDFLGL